MPSERQAGNPEKISGFSHTAKDPVKRERYESRCCLLCGRVADFLVRNRNW
jgi:hypothetical protein